MDWDNIRVFLAVARAGPFVSAARRLKLDHATVSRRIAGLEAALGAKLFDRRTTGATLTSAGERFLTAAEEMESAFLHAQGEISGVDLELVGDVPLPRPRPRFARTRGCPRLPARYARGHPRPRAHQGGDGAPRPGGGARPGVVSLRYLRPVPNLRNNWAFPMSCGAFSVRLAWAGSRAGDGASYFPMLQVVTLLVLEVIAGFVTAMWSKDWWAVGGTSGVE
ncbi:MAG TPA: LysR family transcriptional regulator [Roseiarcus sp.]|nr:LysR family transcriptional regulator [Roseiarcus sp.]